MLLIWKYTFNLILKKQFINIIMVYSETFFKKGSLVVKNIYFFIAGSKVINKTWYDNVSILRWISSLVGERNWHTLAPTPWHAAPTLS